jgi:hypothetical protein
VVTEGAEWSTDPSQDPETIQGRDSGTNPGRDPWPNLDRNLNRNKLLMPLDKSARCVA